MSDPTPARIHFTRTSGGWFLAPGAMITGDVTIGRDASFWFGAVVRGDVAPVVIGERTNIQDNAVVHCDTGIANVIGNDVVVGHSAIVHGAEVGDGVLVGMGAKLLGETRIGRGSLVAAGALVPPRMVVPEGVLVVGSPAKVVRELNDKDRQYMQWLSGHYVELAQKYVDEGFAAGGRPAT